MSEEIKNTERQNGVSRSRRNRKRRSPLVIAILIILLGVMAFSGYELISQFLAYKKGSDSYRDLEKNVVSIAEKPPVPRTSDAAEMQPQAETQPGESGGIPANAKDPGRSESIDVNLPWQSPDASLSWLEIDFEKLFAVNSDVVGWLQGMDDTISYPVVQGTDNDFYVHRLLDHSYNFCGTLFVDFRNKMLEDDITVIYGHKMKNRTMFGQFGLYDTYEYYKDHPVFRLYTPNGSYDLLIKTCVYTSIYEEIPLNFESEEAFNDTMASFERRGQFWSDTDIQYGDKLFCLYTCAYYRENGRMFVLCKAVRVD